VGADGATHAGAFDVAYLANLPNFVVMAASDEAELMHMVRTAAEYDAGPISFRYPRGNGLGVELPKRGEVLEIGKGRIIQEGSDIAILSFGAHLSVVQEAAAALKYQGISVTIADARFAKPLDTELINDLVDNHSAILTVEQGSVGGFSSLVLHHLMQSGKMCHGVNIDCMVLPDRFIDQASPTEMYRDAGMSEGDIIARCIELLSKSLSKSDQQVDKINIQSS
jgi:1-deoxy-D-xylulose-5-phosphate synthase